MDYFGIIKKAYAINLKHKFLWIFGVLIAGIGGASSFSPNFGYQGSSSDTLGQNLTSTQLEQKLVEIWVNYSGLIITGIILLLLASVIFFIFSLISQGALIGSVNKLDKGEKADFRTGLGIGTKNFWRVWGVALIYLLFILASLALLIIPTVLSVLAQSYILAFAWGMLMFFVVLIFWILISLIAPYSTIVVVLDKLSIWDSIRESLHLFQQKWPSIVVMYLILMAIGIAYGMAIFLVFLIIGGFAFAIGLALWLANMWLALIFGFILGLVLIVALIIVNGAFKSFGSTVLVLTYNRLK